MFVSQQVSKSFLDRVMSDYQELYQSIQLNPAEAAQDMRKLVWIKLEAILAMKASSGAGILDASLQRKLKLELRSAQRTWTRHLVTSARLSRQRKEGSSRYLVPVVAA